MLSLCAAVAVLGLGVSFDTAWRFDAGRAADIAHAVLVLLALALLWAPVLLLALALGQA